MKILRIIGMVIGIIAMSLCLYWYDWKLLVILMLAIWGNNLEQKNQ